MNADFERDVEEYFEMKRKRKENVRRGFVFLQQRYVIDILLYMNSHTICMKNDIYSAISRSSAVKDKLDMLENMGLIWSRSVVNARAPVFGMTEKGRMIADKIEELLVLLRE